MLKRISWQAIFSHSSGTGAATTTTGDVPGRMDATKDASGGASFDGARRASTSISVSRQSTDFSMSTLSTLTTTASTAPTAPTSNSNVANSLPSRSSPPPSYLLDDDPFANLTPMTVGTRHRSNSSVGSTSISIPRSQRPPPIHPELVPELSLPAVSVGLQVPKSRLQESLGAGAHESDKVKRPRSQDEQKEAKGKKEESKRKRAKTFFVTMSAPVSPSITLFASKVPVPPLPTNSETMSLPSSPKLPSMFGAPPPTTQPFAMTRIQPRPAHQRPAFAARPSLPSLDTLAKTNVVLTKKVKKGRVGAGLPFEPWDNLPEDDQQPHTVPHNPPTLTTHIPAKTPMKSEFVSAIPDIDRTPTSTPVSAAPGSPTRSSSTSTRPSATPQPFPSQIVALEPSVEDLDTASSLTRSPPLALSAFKADAAALSPVSSSSNVPNNLVDSHALAAPVALLPSVPEASILRSLEAGNDMFRHSDIDSDRNSVEVPEEENGYFNGDLLDTYGISYTPEPEPEFHDSQRRWTDELDHRSDDPEALANKEQQLRWSATTHDSNTESQLHSPIYSSSNSYAGSVSDLSSEPNSYPPSYSFGYGCGWSNSDRDSMTDVSRDLSLSRSVSSTSISTSSIGDDIESNINLSHFRSRSAYTSDGSQGADTSQSVYDHHLLLRSSTLIASSDSGNNSILHSPDSEWAFLTQQRILSHLPDVLVGPALQKRSILPYDSADHQTEQVQGQVDSEPESKTSITSALQNSGQGDPEYAEETTRNQQNDHAVAHDVFDESPATADVLFSTSSTDSAPPKPDFVPFLQHDQESRFSFFEALAEPTFCSATSSDQRSGLDAAGSQQPNLAETALSRTSSSSANPPAQLHLEAEPDNVHEMIGIDKRLREKMTHSEEYFEQPSGLSKDFSSTSPRRGSKSGEEEERRRRVMVLQMQRANTFQSSEDKANKYRGYHKLPDVASTSSAKSASRSISRTPSALASSSSPQQFPAALATSSTSDEEGQNTVSSDDDIPLARRIPGALTAQKSIRKQVNEEREARRAARAKRQRERQVTLRPAGAGLGGVESPSTALSTWQDAASFSNPNALSGTNNTVPQRSGSVHHHRQVMLNMPLAPNGDFGQTFKPEDLARKLQNVKMMSETSNTSPSPAASNMRLKQHHQFQVLHNKLSRSVSGNSRPSLDYSQHTSPVINSASPAPRLKPKRSFHAQEVEHRPRGTLSPQESLPRKRSISVGGGDKEKTSRRGHEDTVPPLPRTNLHDHRDRGRRVLVKGHADSRVTSPYEFERLHTAQDAPIGGVEGSKHRIFIHSLQLSHMVDIRMDTTAGDLITSLETEGVLDGWAGLGGWMVWEVAQDFGMERPVRSYELLYDVQASWMKEKTVNYFILKKSLLFSRLDRSAIPSSAPGHSGWLEWEAKRGKWSKRWLRLKENCLYISKKDGRDETLLCSLSNFDAYYITRSHRAPKPFAFAIKSTDKLSFFENTADYMHTFACSEKDGEAWMEKILIARSYVLHQERIALFHPKSLPVNNANNTGAALSRSGTKKTTVTKLHQPLVNLDPGDIFEPGSLLSKHPNSALL